MKFILCAFFYCSIACAASGDDWSDCGKTPTGSSNELGQIFKKLDPEQLDSTAEEQEPTEEESPTVTAAKQEPLNDEHNQSATHDTVNISPIEKKIDEQNKNDKNQRTNLGFLSKYPFLTNCGLVIPCATAIIYLAYRWRR